MLAVMLYQGHSAWSFSILLVAALGLSAVAGWCVRSRLTRKHFVLLIGAASLTFLGAGIGHALPPAPKNMTPLQLVHRTVSLMTEDYDWSAELTECDGADDQAACVVKYQIPCKVLCKHYGSWVAFLLRGCLCTDEEG